MVDPYLANDITRLQIPNGLDILLHCTIVITLCVEMIAVLSMNVGNARIINPGRSSDADGQSETRLFE